MLSRRLLGLCLFSISTLTTMAAPHGALVRIGEPWHYVRESSAKRPGENWQGRQFDDTRWRVAPSGFVIPEDEPLVVSQPKAVAKPGYVYLRKRFVLNDPAEIRSLSLHVEHEQGFTAYLNGTEIARYRGTGLTPPTPEQRTAGHEDPMVLPVERNITEFKELLVSGDNVLALEGPVTGESVSPFTLAAMMTANFRRGPFVQNASTNSIQIIWLTTDPASTVLHYGPTAALGQTYSNGLPVTEHVVTLTNLRPDTTYFYRAGSDDGESGLVLTEAEKFRTLKMSGRITFVVVGDTGQATPAQTQIATVMRNLDPDLVLHCGDIIYGGFTEATAATRYFNYYQAHIKNTPYYLTVGNHDLGCCAPEIPDFNFTNWTLNTTNYQNTYYLPTNSSTGTEHFYSFDHGAAHFVSLYNPWFEHYKFLVGTDQLTWLTNDLAASTKPWKFLFCHMPPANSGLHWFRDGNENQLQDSVELLRVLAGIAQQYGVNCVFTGHDHNFERFAPTNGLHYIVAGGGGGGVYQFSSRHPASAQFWAVNHCVKATLTEETLTLQAVNTSGAVFDSMVIHRAAAPTRVHASTWNTPVIETTAASNGDGNITGQTFDLLGPSILTRHGQFSNMGEFFVNNDSTNLYLGFKSSMIYGNNNLFLFVESPRQIGTATLATVGNGIIDPSDEGADGLDCLANLSFTGFAPSIGCILGDEFADVTARKFLRTKLGLDIGHGVFYLDASLTSVSTARFQQFNRSPESSPAAGEQSADLIEVCIPFSALGGIQPGDIIKVAAVVGGYEFDGASQTRQLDTAVLGASLSGSGQDPVTLGAVSVRLAFPPNLDTDGDGLLDNWELAYGLQPDSGAGDDGTNGDPDHDGFTNAQEQMAGTDPRNAASVLRLSLSPIAPHRYRVAWQAVPGKRYQLEYATEPVTNFTSFTGMTWPRMAMAPEEIFEDDSSLESQPPAVRYYRLQLLP